MRKPKIVLKPGDEPLTEKVAEYIGCMNDEQCGCGWDWRKCHDCIENARGVIEIVRSAPPAAGGYSNV